MKGLRIALTDDGYQVTPFEGGLAELQAAVGGLIEPVPSDPVLTLWVNDDGKGRGLAPNILAMDVWLRYDVYHCILAGDWLAGPVVATGGVDSEGNTTDLGATEARWILSVARDAGAVVL